MLKNRAIKIWKGKTVDQVKMEGGEIYWYPPEVEAEFDPDINAYVQEGFVISEPGWQEWLDQTLEQGLDGEPYRLVVIDTLMMVMGEVDENRSAEMTRKVFRPLKMLMRKHESALQVVHHMSKGNPKFATRSGQRLLGSTANHAWSEDSSIWPSASSVRLKSRWNQSQRPAMSSSSMGSIEARPGSL